MPNALATPKGRIGTFGPVLHFLSSIRNTMRRDPWLLSSVSGQARTVGTWCTGGSLRTSTQTHSHTLCGCLQVIPGTLTDKSYRIVSFIDKGSGGGIYGAIQVRGKDRQPSLNRPRTAGNEPRVQHDLVIKKIYDTQRASAEQEYEIATLLAQVRCGAGAGAGRWY